MKIELTEKQIETLQEALDFWCGSLVGIEEYSAEYKRARKMEEVLLSKVRKAKAEKELAENRKAQRWLININSAEQMKELALLKMRARELQDFLA